MLVGSYPTVSALTLKQPTRAGMFSAAVVVINTKVLMPSLIVS
jgi:hypothetical protein